MFLLISTWNDTWFLVFLFCSVSSLCYELCNRQCYHHTHNLESIFDLLKLYISIFSQAKMIFQRRGMQWKLHTCEDLRWVNCDVWMSMCHLVVSVWSPYIHKDLLAPSWLCDAQLYSKVGEDYIPGKLPAYGSNIHIQAGARSSRSRPRFIHTLWNIFPHWDTNLSYLSYLGCLNVML